MFDIAVAFKAIDGVLEIVGGYFLVFRPGWIGPAAVTWATTLLAHDQASRFAHVLSHWGDGLTLDTEHFASSYLIAHGTAKVFIAWGLIRERLWAFSCSACSSSTNSTTSRIRTHRYSPF